MMGILGKIFGSGDVIKSGMDLLDDAFYTDEEEAADKQAAKIANSREKTNAKVSLMKAYAPFKVAQRYLALMFGINFIASYWMVIIMYFMGKDISKIIEIIEMFQVGWIMMTIVMFYFGAGLANTIGKKFNPKQKES